MIMEIFRIELQNRYKVLSTSFPKTPVTFKSFHRFVKGNYFEFIDEEGVAELWRETNIVFKFILFLDLTGTGTC